MTLVEKKREEFLEVRILLESILELFVLDGAALVSVDEIHDTLGKSLHLFVKSRLPGLLLLGVLHVDLDGNAREEAEAILKLRKLKLAITRSIVKDEASLKPLLKSAEVVEAKDHQEFVKSHLVVLVHVRQLPDSAHDLLGGFTGFLEAIVPLILSDVVLASSKLIETLNEGFVLSLASLL